MSIGEFENGADREAIQDLLHTLHELLTALKVIYDRWCDAESGIGFSLPSNGLRAEKEHTGHRGRPKYIIKQEQLLFLRELRLTWTKISEMYEISRRTMYNIRTSFGLTGPAAAYGFSDITDHDLQILITEIKQEMPHIGICMLRGILESKGHRISITRLRDCVAVLEPVNRWAIPIRRRVYSVPHPNALWHIDGNHKLVR